MANDKPFKIKNGLSAKRYLQSSVAVAASDIDLSTGSYFSKALSADTTFTFSNPPTSGKAMGFALEVTGASTYTITWPSSIKWSKAETPDSPPSGETDVYIFVTTDGGTTYYATQAGNALA
jgi:hypothetical protein